VIYNGVTIISSQRLDLKLLKHSETSILNGNGYIPITIQKAKNAPCDVMAIFKNILEEIYQ